MLFRYPSWLLPWRNRLVVQLISHKYLRLVAPLFMVAAFVTSLGLAIGGSLFFLFAAVAQGAFYLAALMGILLPGISWRGIGIPAAFVFLNFMTVLGLCDYLGRRSKHGW